MLNPTNWIHSYADELYSYAMHKTGNTELAEDLVQETFLAGLKSQHTFRGNCSERTWLYAILKYKIADHYRKASTKPEISHSNMRGEEDVETDHYFTEDGGWKKTARPKDWAVDYSRTLENKELAAALNACIEKLSEGQKQLVILKLIEEVDVQKICKELKLTATNYWVIIHRAKLQLRACLENTWFKA